MAHYLAEFGLDVLCIGPFGRGDDEWDRKEKCKVYRFYGYNLGYLRFFPFLMTFIFVLLKYKPKKVLAMNIGYGGIISYF